MTAKSKSDADASASNARSQGSTYTHGGDTEKVFHRENADIGTEEAQASSLASVTQAWAANQKRLYDEMLGVSLESCRRSRDYFDEVKQESLNHMRNVNALVLNTISNAQSVSNGENQRTVRHSDIAVDRMWNVDEVAFAVKEILTEDQPFKDGIAALALQALANVNK